MLSVHGLLGEMHRCDAPNQYKLKYAACCFTFGSDNAAFRFCLQMSKGGRGQPETWIMHKQGTFCEAMGTIGLT